MLTVREEGLYSENSEEADLLLKKRAQILKMIANIVVGYLIFLLATKFAFVVSGRCDDWIITGRLVTAAVQIFSVWFCLYLYTKYILKASLQDFYMGKPGPERGWCIAAVLMPLAIAGFYLIFVPGELTMGHYPANETAGLLISSILIYGLTSGITEEMVFRGLMLKSIWHVFGKKTAVILTSILFAMNHLVIIDTSEPENVIVLMICITVAGGALALITCHTGSVWSAVVVHVVYNILGGGSSLFQVLAADGWEWPAIFTWRMHSSNPLLTGIPGANNPDTALPAVIGFAVLGCIALYRIRREKKVENSKGKEERA